MIEVLIISAILLIYFLAIKHHRYWSDRHVETGKVIPIFGDSLYMALGKASMAETMEVMYNKLENKRYIGCYQFTSPVLVLKCPKLIQQIFIKDFDHVVNRKSFTPDSAGSLWNKSVLLLKGQDWKNMRSILSPLFTSSKMKSMFILICHNTNLFVQHFLNKEKESIDVDMKDAFTRFSMDLVATSTFGIQNDSLENRDNDFYKMGKHAADFATFRVKFVFFLYQLSQTISNYFGISMLCQEVEDYYRNLVEETIKIRSEKNIKRPDILGLLLESKIKKELDSKTNDSNEDNSEIQNIKQHLNNEEITSQLFIFLIAGFDTLTTTMCLLSYELAVNPDIQERLIEEIDRNRPLDGAPTYETIMNMTYLDMVISETQRKWPSVVFADRVVIKPLEIKPEEPGEEPLILEKDLTVLVPIFAIHRDPKNFEDPEKFDPERFSPENRKKIIPHTFMPFGVGPRNCIGSRLALMEMKTVFFYLLSNFRIVPTESTQIPLRFDKSTLTFNAEKGFHFALQRRN